MNKDLVMTKSVRDYLKVIGKRGGMKSRRVLSRSDASSMVLRRWDRKLHRCEFCHTVVPGKYEDYVEYLLDANGREVDTYHVCPACAGKMEELQEKRL